MIRLSLQQVLIADSIFNNSGKIVCLFINNQKRLLNVTLAAAEISECGHLMPITICITKDSQVFINTYIQHCNLIFLNVTTLWVELFSATFGQKCRIGANCIFINAHLGLLEVIC